MKNKTALLVILTLISVLLIFILSGCGGGQESVDISTARIYEEKYFVLLSSPPANKTFSASDPAPEFIWSLQRGSTYTHQFTIEIDYMKNGSYMSITFNGGVGYALSESDWNTIKNNAPKTDGIQEIFWRIRIDYYIYPEEGPYYSGWGYFWIDHNLIE